MNTALYRETDDGLDYWESWVEDGGEAVVHYGRLGERGTVERYSHTEFVDYLSAKVCELHAAGYMNIPAEEHETVMVQWPRNTIPDDPDALDALWEKVEHWVNEELGWTGLGSCDGIHLSTEFVAMAEVVDASLAVKVLASALVQSDLPAGGVIAVREDDVDVVRWPPERDGEDVSEALPPA